MKTKTYKLLIISALVIFTGICIGNISTITSWFKQYRYVSEFNDSIRIGHLKNDKWVLLDSLEHRISPVVDNFFDHDGTDSLVVYSNDGYRGYYNIITQKDQISSNQKRFVKAWCFDSQSGLAAVLDTHNNKIGFINRAGQYVIKPQFVFDNQYDYVFSENECIVSDSLGTFKIINTKGISKYGKNYYSTIEAPYNRIRLVSDVNEKYGLLKDSTILLPCEYDQIDITEDEIFLTKDAKKWGIDYRMRIKSPEVFDDVTNLFFRSVDQNIEDDEDSETTEADTYKRIASTRLSVINVNYSYGLFDNQKKKVIVPAIYDEIYALGTPRNLTIWGKKNDVMYLIK